MVRAFDLREELIAWKPPVAAVESSMAPLRYLNIYIPTPCEEAAKDGTPEHPLLRSRRCIWWPGLLEFMPAPL